MPLESIIHGNSLWHTILEHTWPYKHQNLDLQFPMAMVQAAIVKQSAFATKDLKDILSSSCFHESLSRYLVRNICSLNLLEACFTLESSSLRAINALDIIWPFASLHYTIRKRNVSCPTIYFCVSSDYIDVWLNFDRMRLYLSGSSANAHCTLHKNTCFP